MAGVREKLLAAVLLGLHLYLSHRSPSQEIVGASPDGASFDAILNNL